MYFWSLFNASWSHFFLPWCCLLNPAARTPGYLQLLVQVAILIPHASGIFLSSNGLEEEKI